MPFIKLLLICVLGSVGVMLLVSLFKDNKKKAQQTPITLVTLANELWLKGSGKVAVSNRGKEKGEGGSATADVLPVAADFKLASKTHGVSDEDSSSNGGADEETADDVSGAKEEAGGDERSVPVSPGRDLSKTLPAFRREFIEPHGYYLTEQRADTIVDKLLDILAEHAGLSSIVTDKTDEEFIELAEIAPALAKVKLITHTETVTRLMIDMCREQVAEPEKMMPVVLVAALGHDIGKIHEGNHPVRSAEMLSQLIPDDIVWKRRVIHAVMAHHGQADDQVSVMLKSADMKARGYEIASAVQGVDVRPFEGWFDGASLVKKYIEPEVNITQMHTCNAFSLNGVVYAKADFIYDAAHQMSKDAKVVDVRFFYPSEKDGVIRSVVKALRDGGYVHESLKHDVFTMKYELGFDKPAMKRLSMQLVPLKGDAFDLEAAEGRKADFLADLKELKEVHKSARVKK